MKFKIMQNHSSNLHYRMSLFCAIIGMILISSSHILNAQDSLLISLSEIKNPEAKLPLLKKIINTNFYNNTNLADSCANIYMHIFETIGNDSTYASSIAGKASVKLVKAEYDSVFYYANNALEVIGPNRHPSVRSKILHVQALTYYYQGNYEKSLEQNFESLKIRESLGRPDLQIISLTNIAINYERLADYDNAISYNEKALSLTPDDDIYSKATLANNIAVIYRVQNKFHEALEKSLESNKNATAINNQLLILDTNLGIAQCYVGLKRYQEAIPFANEAVKIGEEINNKAKLISALNLKGGLYTKMDHHTKALPLLERALKISIDNDIKENRIDVYKNLSDVYQYMDNYKESGRMKDSILSMKYKLYTEEKIKIAKELNVKYESAQKDIKLKENEIIQVKQKQLKNLLMIGAAGLMMLCLFIWAYMRKRIKTNRKIALQESMIQSQRIEQLEQENKILAMSSMIKGQESERKRIAQDLHDGLGGLLATIKVKFGIIQKEIAALESMNVYQQTSNMIDDACSEVRKIAHNMMPDALGKLGLLAAIQDIADHTTDLDIKVMDLGMRKLTEAQEIMLYRVIQEFINNTRKHAEASQIIIQFSSDDKYITIDLEDDGKGYIQEGIHNQGLGLKNIASRINLIKGNLEIDSQLDEGTTMHIQVPIE